MIGYVDRNKIIFEQGREVVLPIKINYGIIAAERVTDLGSKVVVGFYGAGDSLGLADWFCKKPVMYTAKAITPVGWEHFAEKEKAYIWAKKMAEKIKNTRMLWTDNATNGMVRFLHFNMWYAKRFGVKLKEKNKYKVVGYPSHAQIGWALNTQRVTASRYIMLSRNAGILQGKSYEMIIDIEKAQWAADSIIFERDDFVAR